MKEQVSQKFKQVLGLLHFCFAMRGVSMPFHLLPVDAAKRTSAFKARCGIGRRAVRSSQFWALLSPGCCTCAPCRKLWRGEPGLLALHPRGAGTAGKQVKDVLFWKPSHIKGAPSHCTAAAAGPRPEVLYIK